LENLFVIWAVFGIVAYMLYKAIVGSIPNHAQITRRAIYIFGDLLFGAFLGLYHIYCIKQYLPASQKRSK